MRAAWLAACALLGCAAVEPDEPTTAVFANPQRVEITGYTGDAMEPFVTPDGRMLLFNDLNEPNRNTDLHYAVAVDTTHFRYVGRLGGVASPALEGVASSDRAGRLYLISPRDYDTSGRTIWTGHLDGAGEVTGLRILAGNVAPDRPAWFNMDAAISPDGATLYYTVNRMGVLSRTVEESDIRVAARRADGGFDTLPAANRLLANINTAALEYAPAISADGLELFFTRASGSGDGVNFRTLMATRATTAAPFGRPRRIAAITGFAEGPALSPDGRSLYYHRKDGERFVVYRVTRSR